MTLLNARTQIDQLDVQGDGASPRMLHACERAGIVTLGDLAAYGARNFYVTKHCGHRTVAQARAILRSAGLAFRDEAVPERCPVTCHDPSYKSACETPHRCKLEEGHPLCDPDEWKGGHSPFDFEGHGEDSFQLWQRIETAPKDGTYILLCGDSGYTTTPYRVAVGCWIEGYRNHWLTHSNDAFTDDGAEPTHWQPLPAPPKETP